MSQFERQPSNLGTSHPTYFAYFQLTHILHEKKITSDLSASRHVTPFGAGPDAGCIGARDGPENGRRPAGGYGASERHYEWNFNRR